MRISDWSSDVCSSDLERAPESGAARSHAAGGGHETEHQQRREAKAGEDESEGRNLAQRDAQKEEGASPQNREQDQHTPFGAAHPEVDRCCHDAALAANEMAKHPASCGQSRSAGTSNVSFALPT